MTAQIIFGQSDAVARELVTALNDASTANLFCLSLTAETVYARKMNVTDIPKTGEPVNVQVFPGHDAADRVGISGIYDDVYGVHVLLQQHVADAPETQVPLLMLLRSQIAKFLCSKALTCPEGTVVDPFERAHVVAHRHGNEGVYDLGRLEALNVFYSDMIVTYRAAGLRRRTG